MAALHVADEMVRSPLYCLTHLHGNFAPLPSQQALNLSFDTIILHELIISLKHCSSWPQEAQMCTLVNFANAFEGTHSVSAEDQM